MSTPPFQQAVPVHTRGEQEHGPDYVPHGNVPLDTYMYPLFDSRMNTDAYPPFDSGLNADAYPLFDSGMQGFPNTNVYAPIDRGIHDVQLNAVAYPPFNSIIHDFQNANNASTYLQFNNTIHNAHLNTEASIPTQTDCNIWDFQISAVYYVEETGFPPLLTNFCFRYYVVYCDAN